MLNFLPIPTELKLDLSAALLETYAPVFQDKTILIIMAMMIMSDSGKGASLKKYAMNLLARYLNNIRGGNYSVDMQTVVNCIESLPKLFGILDLVL